jgi:hypothetical protein
MTMGDRIKTRQQLLDEQTDATNSRTAPGDDRHNKRARPHQAHDSTAEHADQDDTEVQGDEDAVRQELAEMRQRMAVIKHEITVESQNQADGSPGVSVAAGPCPGRHG